MKTTAYMRVSTDQQDEASQRDQIARYITQHGKTVDIELVDISSGSVPWIKRPLANWIATAQPGDWLIVSEISRIARSTVGVLTFLQAAAERGLNVLAIRSGIAIDGTLQSTIVVTMLALAAEIERELLRERTKAALADRKKRGLPLGRQAGARIACKLDKHERQIDTLLDAGVSVRAIARILDVAPSTAYTWINSRATNASHAATDAAK